ncbi:retinaldehyde-binding protein 1-like [Argiope bruennichi]|uniref:Alpha-tocopherol transfer protein-like n=1 Tax=Argiope bruennichi TaxID=94029 RepID=A0A8T0ESA8_ARGBR|nr:retinaldehyde-binding protein 1-like [Argiope bruennichi]XP_055944021.1 retinaldehyde-binding protein 1-like [Argiope bruennichi]XP_055944022.1 retinaldehyde-binding protein 1-like [Argiope bruennichi]XP_055944023.1 retinaldehyde-binding protein 1-like [Argiope bruennichi]XP_055944024.1 retinaldehyde-binding protein 1-like [Argiope bruennichi]XP_055944025.1 retinaldehyde-binding protein 1-like [Argiope bruennichi]XP_055944026.1 retinaldehyde-binding protein 1-like [Argiope bruennichi]XP_0
MTSKYDDMMKGKNYLPYNIDYMPPKIRQKAKDELKETDEIVAPSLEKMRELIRGEKRFKCPMNDEFLIQFLRARKFDVKKAFALLQSMFEVKKSYSDMYDQADMDALRKVVAAGPGYCFPYRDPDGCVVLVLQLNKWNPDESSISIGLTALTALLLSIVENPVTQVCGVRVLVDVKGFTLRQMRSVTPRYIHLLSRALRNCFPIRFKGIHFFNESTIFQYVWSVLKIVLTEKIRKRVHFHGDNQKSLHKLIPKEILNAEYGGDNICYDGGEWSTEEINKYAPTFQMLMTQGYY